MDNMKTTVFALLALALFNGVVAEINVCSNVTNGIFLADLDNCSNYITCWDNVAYQSSCPESLYFSAETQRCDTASVTNCVQKCNSTLTSFAYDKTCTKYVLCFDNTPVVQQCLDDLQYNSATDRCDYPQNVDCQANLCTGVNDPSNIVYLASHASCSKYYICYNGQAVARECSSGLLFNLEKKGCDYKANVNCTIASTKRTLQPYSKMPPTRADIACPAEGSHFYPKENDSTSYYFCMNGKGVILTCSPGLVYDKKMESCRDPSNIE